MTTWQGWKSGKNAAITSACINIAPRTKPEHSQSEGILLKYMLLWLSHNTAVRLRLDSQNSAIVAVVIGTNEAMCWIVI